MTDPIPYYVIRYDNGSYNLDDGYEVKKSEATRYSTYKEAEEQAEGLVGVECIEEVKHLLDIPEPPKTLDEISQELDEKIDKLIEDIKRNFYGSKIYADSKYEKEFDRIFDNFTYALEHGSFPLQYTSSGTFLISNSDNNISFTTQFRAGDGEVGYWFIQPNIQVYLKKKPNPIVRYFTKLLLNFEWKDK